MAVVSVILGILLIISGFSCMFTPFATFLSAGYFVGIMMFAYGIAGIIKAFQKRSTVLDTVMSILAFIVGIISLIRPGTTLVFDMMILYLVAFWFLMRGIIAIVVAFQVKGISSNWFLGLIIGILSVILGIYSFAHPAVTAFTTGFLIGFYFVETGIDLILATIMINKIKDAV
ncbi:MAG: DUF308 domain-containing protein [Lachnospiraceae bacterium]|nr:DUF308 domain-containing protein [Lachnospiraceae bacterium]